MGKDKPSGRGFLPSCDSHAVSPQGAFDSLPVPGKKALAVRQPRACHPTPPGKCCRPRVRQVGNRVFSPAVILPSTRREFIVLGEPNRNGEARGAPPPRQSGSWSESRLGQSAFGARPGRSLWGQAPSAPSQLLGQRAARAPWRQAGASLPVPVIKYAGTRDALRAYKEFLQTTFLALRHRRLRRPFRGAPA